MKDINRSVAPWSGVTRAISEIPPHNTIMRYSTLPRDTEEGLYNLEGTQKRYWTPDTLDTEASMMHTLI